jgi:erythromycin esterase-like protein
MIEWMRRHNQDPGGAPRVGFHGFDMQFARVAMDDVEAFLALHPLRGSPPASAAWMSGPLSMRRVGSLYSPLIPANYLFPTPLPQWFDVVIHFAETTPSTLLPFVR